MKKIFCVLLITVMLFSLSACSNSSSENSAETPTSSNSESSAQTGTKLTPADLKIGIVMKSFDEFQNQVIAGATDEAIAQGVKKENIIALAPKSESGVAEQVQMIEDCIAQGVHILLVSAQDPNAVNAPLAAASAKGIKIVMVDTDAPNFKDPNKVTYIGTDNYTAAHDGAAEFIKRFLKSGQNVVILRGKLGDPNHDARTKGLQDACKEAEINVLEVQDANCESEKAASIMENLITKYGDKINGLLVTSDNMAIGAVTSIKAANMIDKVAVCGFDGFQVCIKAVADGDVKMIIAQKPYWMGQEGAKCGIGALLEGKTYDPYIDPGIAIIDQSNYKDFLK